MIALRRVLRPVHRWVGLTVGLVIVWMAVTGSLLVFRKQLEVPLDRDLLSVPACTQRMSLDALTANAVKANPKGKLDYIRLIAGEPGEARMPAAMIRFTDQMFVYLNPCTGEALGQRGRFSGPFGWFEQLHRFRFMPNGNLIVGSSAIVFGLPAVSCSGGPAPGVALGAPWPCARRALAVLRATSACTSRSAPMRHCFCCSSC